MGEPQILNIFVLCPFLSLEIYLSQTYIYISQESEQTIYIYIILNTQMTTNTSVLYHFSFQLDV
jgi:hypothetical protein